MTDWKLWIENTVREDGVQGWRPYERQRYLDGINSDRGNYFEGTYVHVSILLPLIFRAQILPLA